MVDLAPVPARREVERRRRPFAMLDGQPARFYSRVPERRGGVFTLFANCIAVKGARRSVVCDLQKQRAQLVPNGLFDILTEHAGQSTETIKAIYQHRHDDIIDRYFTLLLDGGYGFYCDEPERFPPLDLTWDRPEAITNGIVDVDGTSRHDFPRLFAQFDELGCEALQIRIFDAIGLAGLQAIVAASADRHLRHLELVIKYSPDLTVEALRELCLRHQWIGGVVVHASVEDTDVALEPYPIAVRYRRDEMAPACCGEVDPAQFVINVEHFTEARRFNTCLNRKLSICANGEIKACPSMPRVLGHTATHTLAEAMRHPALAEDAAITKDMVSVCRDCEFRYICTDCRAHVVDPADPLSKPANCRYDPYTARWAESAR